MTDNGTQIVAETLSFRRNGIVVMTYRQEVPSTEVDGESEERWIFHSTQIAGQNNIPIPQINDNHEYVARSVEERDALAEKLLDAVDAARGKVEEMRAAVTDAFTQALPAAD